MKREGIGASNERQEANSRSAEAPAKVGGAGAAALIQIGEEKKGKLTD